MPLSVGFARIFERLASGSDSKSSFAGLCTASGLGFRENTRETTISGVSLRNGRGQGSFHFGFSFEALGFEQRQGQMNSQLSSHEISLC